MKSNPSTRRVNVRRLKPVVDDHMRRRAAGRPADPDEQAPPCPECRSAADTVWFRDRRTGLPQIVCTFCTPFQPTNEFPERDAPGIHVR